ncbi:trypsin-like serine protease [Nannocystaceae bacterium ST9]
MTRLRSIGPALLTLGLLPTLALAGPPEALQSGADHDPNIYGGSAANYCGWPTAIYLDFGFSACSGTLVHPDIVITAAHCPDTPSGKNATVRFGEDYGGGERAVSATCYSNPGYTGSVGETDYAYCRLSQSVTDIPIIPPAFGCDTSALSIGREVVIVGFGESDNGGSGSKREVTTTIEAIGQTAFIGGNGKDACFGDSGGPVFIQLKSEFGGDDTWRAFGITSGGADCGSGGTYSLMHVAIPWIEDHSGVDITPCHDSQGNWAPTPDCGGMPYDPAAGQGSWNSGCSDGPVSGFGGLCGEPFGSGDDMDPPSVSIVAPGNGDVIDVPPGETQAEVTIDVEADDGDGFGVAEVRLLINGSEFAGNTDSTAPYSWTLVFNPGAYTIEAIAEDFVGNEGSADPVGIGVGQDPPDVPDGDTGDADTGAGDTGDGAMDGGADEVGESGGDDAGITVTADCNCSTDEPRPISLLAGLGLLGLLGLRRRGK